MEQTEKQASLNFLRALPAEHVLVSFPTRTLGGRTKNMADFYEVAFLRLLSETDWPVVRTAFDNELCFLVTK